MTDPRLLRQVNRRGPVLCYYRADSVQRPGYRWSRHPGLGWLLSFGARGHCLAIGWFQ